MCPKVPVLSTWGYESLSKEVEGLCRKAPQYCLYMVIQRRIDYTQSINYNYTPRHEYDLLLLIIITDLMI